MLGLALYQAQLGLKAAEAKPLHRFGGAGVLEIVDDYQGDNLSCGLHGEVCRHYLRTAYLPEEI